MLPRMPLLAAVALLLAVPPPAPTAPEPPATIPIVTGPFMLFFDWDSSQLSPQSAAILDNVILAHGTRPEMPILIEGHADRSGPAAANLRLSRRRAERVEAYFTRRGIPAALTTITSFGEFRPLVPTDDGARERQNRRVEINFGPPKPPTGR
jgi:outer membrane protein OmpA-like peptidoglycan-associated protein